MLLEAQGWASRTVLHQLLGPMVEARRGDCRMLLHFASPDGASDGKFRAVAKAYGPVSYRHGGRIEPAMPQTAALLGWHAQRYTSGFGLAVPTAPVIAEARAPECGDARPDLSALRQQLRPLSRTAS